MQSLRNKIKLDKFNNQFSNILLNSENHFNNLYKVCGNKFLKGCGSYLIDGQNYNYYIDLYDKQKFLFEKVKEKKNLNVLEIGTYMGHSLLIMLLANNKLSVTCIDIDDTFSKPAVDYLSKAFPNSNLEFIKGNSLDVLKKLKKKYNFFLIDGTHRNTQVTREFTYCINNLISNNRVDFVLDDAIHAKPLKNNIFSSFSIKDTLSIDVPGGNLYFDIEFPKNVFYFYYKKQIFFIKNLLWYLKKKIFKILKFQKI